jgi:hypothetical protein
LSAAVTVSFFSAAGLPISGFASRAFGSALAANARQVAMPPAEPTRLAAKNSSVGVLSFGEDDMMADPFALVGTMPEIGTLAGDGPNGRRQRLKTPRGITG